MSCEQRCVSGFKFVGTAGGSKGTNVVQSLARLGNKIRVTNIDGSTYDLEMKDTDTLCLSTLDILNASGTKTVASVVTGF